jgi:hypothetical protein
VTNPAAKHPAEEIGEGKETQQIDQGLPLVVVAEQVQNGILQALNRAPNWSKGETVPMGQ